MSGNRGGNRTSGGRHKSARGKNGGQRSVKSPDSPLSPLSPASPASPSSPSSGRGAFDYLETREWMNSQWVNWSKQTKVSTFSCSGGNKREEPAPQVLQCLQDMSNAGK